MLNGKKAVTLQKYYHCDCLRKAKALCQMNLHKFFHLTAQVILFIHTGVFLRPLRRFMTSTHVLPHTLCHTGTRKVL